MTVILGRVEEGTSNATEQVSDQVSLVSTKMDDATLDVTACLAREQNCMTNELRHHRNFLFQSNTLREGIFK